MQSVIIPITVFILMAFMKSIPTDLEEAAVIDGFNAGKVFWIIIMPVSSPAIVTATISILLIFGITAYSLWYLFPIKIIS